VIHFDDVDAEERLDIFGLGDRGALFGSVSRLCDEGRFSGSDREVVHVLKWMQEPSGLILKIRH